MQQGYSGNHDKGDLKNAANHAFYEAAGHAVHSVETEWIRCCTGLLQNKTALRVCFDVAKPDPKQCKRCPFFNTFGGPIAMLQRCKFISNFQNDRASLRPPPQLLVDRCPTALDWHLIPQLHPALSSGKHFVLAKVDGCCTNLPLHQQTG